MGLPGSGKTTLANELGPMLNSVEVNKDNKDSVLDFLETLEEDDDVQNVYSNFNFGGI